MTNDLQPLHKWAKDAAQGKTDKIPYIDITNLINEVTELRAKVESLSADAERWQFRQQILKNNGCVAWAGKVCMIYQHGQVIGRGDSEEKAIDAAIIATKE